VLDTLSPEATADSVRYRYVELKLDHENRTAELVVDGPQGVQPETPHAILRAGADFWPLRAFREIDDALLRLRFHYDKIGLVALKTRGDLAAVRQIDTTLYQLRNDWLVNEILLLIGRTLRRLDLTARSLFAMVEEGSCFAGSLLEMALAADRIYMLRDAAGRVRVASSPLNGGLVPMTHGLSRLQVRFMAEPERVEEIAGASEPFETEAAERAGLATAAVDAIDWEDELRVAIEERVSLSPDALTGMEANLRFAGAENPDSKIFSRLSAWQNWIFSRPNATGERGALTLYGKPERPQFDWRRT
jgi:benzoyl-CoA-dihydrodiol lyase